MGRLGRRPAGRRGRRPDWSVGKRHLTLDPGRPRAVVAAPGPDRHRRDAGRELVSGTAGRAPQAAAMQARYPQDTHSRQRTAKVVTNPLFLLSPLPVGGKVATNPLFLLPLLPHASLNPNIGEGVMTTTTNNTVP